MYNTLCELNIHSEYYYVAGMDIVIWCFCHSVTWNLVEMEAYLVSDFCCSCIVDVGDTEKLTTFF